MNCRSRLYAALLLAVLATRAWILQLDPLPYTDLNIYARYAREGIEAGALGVSFYDWHRLQVAAAARAHPQEPSLAAPWRYRIEYPPLAVRWMTWVARAWGLQPGPGFRAAYVAAYRKTMLGVDVCTFAALMWLLRGHPPRPVAVGLGLYAGAGLLLAHLIYDRMDLLLGCLIAAGLAAVTAGRSGPAVGALALGIHLKLAPVFLAPAWLAWPPPRSPRPGWVAAAARRGLACAALVAVGFAGFVATDGWEAVGFLDAQMSRDFEVGSGTASLLLVARGLGAPVRTIRTQGSIGLAAPWLPAVPGIQLALQAGVVLLVAALLLRARSRPASPGRAGTEGLLAVATVATLLGVLLTARVFSPQYLLWLLPGMPLLAVSPARSRLDPPAFLLIAALTTLIWPVLFQDHVVGRVTVPGVVPELSGPTRLGAALLIARNLLVTAWFGALLRRLVRVA